jgi:hypothetical protein
MSVIEEFVALQLPGTLMERLQQMIGQPVLVYLSGVHIHSMSSVPYLALSEYLDVDSLGWPCPRPGRPCPPGPGPGRGPGPGPDPDPWPPCPPSPPPQPGPCPGPQPEPCPGLGMDTAVIAGTLTFAGVDHLALSVAHEGVCREMLIPYTAIGMIVELYGCISSGRGD